MPAPTSAPCAPMRVRDGKQWVINGQKIWATGAGAKNNVINVYVKTDPKAHYRQGMSLFLVDNDTPGLDAAQARHARPPRHRHIRDSPSTDVRVPADRLIGGENKGWDVRARRPAGRARRRRRRQCAARRKASSISRSQYAKERKQFGRPIGANQAIAHMLADMQTEVEAARTLMWRAAWLVSTGQDALREITMAKLFSVGDLRQGRQPGHAGAWAASATARSSTWSAITATPAPPPSRPAPRRFSAT